MPCVAGFIGDVECRSLTTKSIVLPAIPGFTLRILFIHSCVCILYMLLSTAAVCAFILRILVSYLFNCLPVHSVPHALLTNKPIKIVLCHRYKQLNDLVSIRRNVIIAFIVDASPFCVSVVYSFKTNASFDMSIQFGSV